MKIVLSSAALCVFAWSSGHAGCSAELSQRAHATQALVDSLHFDKPGQARVFASDGTEFSGTDAHWMQAQLRKLRVACEHSDETTAVSALKGIDELIASHKHKD